MHYRSLLLPLLLGSLSLGTATASLAAGGHDHHQQHGDSVQTLRLDNGKRWVTDAPLRKAMGELGSALHATHDAIHQDRLPTAEYERLAALVNDQVAYMVKNCSLPEQADAQLHLVIASLLAGAEEMAGHGGEGRRAGAVRVITALNDYGSHFDHPGFKRF